MTQPDTTTTEGKIAVMQAAVEGKRVQYKGASTLHEWRSEIGHETLEWSWGKHDYRIHPEECPKKLRPWKSEEVPVCIVRPKPGTAFAAGLKDEPRWMVWCVSKDALCFGYANPTNSWTFDWCLENIEHSTDGGKTWLPCGVVEE